MVDIANEESLRCTVCCDAGLGHTESRAVDEQAAISKNFGRGQNAYRRRDEIGGCCYLYASPPMHIIVMACRDALRSKWIGFRGAARLK